MHRPSACPTARPSSSASSRSRASWPRHAGSPSPPSTQPRFGDGARLFDENYARLLAAEGHYEEALARLDRTEQMQTSVTNPVWRPWRTYRAPILAAVGRIDEARELMVEEVRMARQWGAGSVLGRTLRVAGELGGPGSEEMLREALELLRPSVARFELACAELAVARVSTDAAERESLLRAALDRSLECGSPGLYRLAAAELIADGIEVPPDPANVFTPTQTERRIINAVAGGYTPPGDRRGALPDPGARRADPGRAARRPGRHRRLGAARPAGRPPRLIRRSPRLKSITRSAQERPREWALSERPRLVRPQEPFVTAQPTTPAPTVTRDLTELTSLCGGAVHLPGDAGLRGGAGALERRRRPAAGRCRLPGQRGRGRRRGPRRRRRSGCGSPRRAPATTPARSARWTTSSWSAPRR